MLIRLEPYGADEGPRCAWTEDRFVPLADDAPAPDGDGGLILSPARLGADGEALAAGGRPLGVRLGPADEVEAVADHLPRLALVAIDFAKFRDGRPYSAAQVLRERFGFVGEVRAVGEVLREQAWFMVRCGFDAFEPADGSTPDEWAKAARRYRHVYQRAADGREPVFALRARMSSCPTC